ncbi:hypothetical protein BaRGS_00037276 [Batillaria attramentaria]|uniref:SAM domain-containing protein n=1 Tax=Batillaria attramentaria TaxID=370345 RepID=A0ABD0J933_9CAEN
MASGTESATETSFWIKFFTDSGIPAGDAAHYAVLFTDNRIQRGMLMDLTKEYLKDMGMSRLGDIIAVLKHAKEVHDQDAKDKALKGAKFTAGSAAASPSPRRSTAASRMVGHFLAKVPDAAPMNQPPAPKPAQDAGSSLKTSVFDRLGSDSPGGRASPKMTVTGVGSSSVFSRLGGKAGVKRPASSTSPSISTGDDDSDEGAAPTSPLQYHGVLKFTDSAKKVKETPPRKKIRVTLQDQVKVTVPEVARPKPQAQTFKVTGLQPLKVQVTSTTASPKFIRTTPTSRAVGKMLSAAKKTSIQKAEVSTTTSSLSKSQGVLSMDAPTQNVSAKTRLGKKVETAPASSTTSGFGSSAKATKSAGGVKSRLGPKTSQSITTKTSVTSSQTKDKASAGVFSRLGKKAAVS